MFKANQSVQHGMAGLNQTPVILSEIQILNNYFIYKLLCCAQKIIYALILGIRIQLTEHKFPSLRLSLLLWGEIGIHRHLERQRASFEFSHFQFLHMLPGWTFFKMLSSLLQEC